MDNLLKIENGKPIARTDIPNLPLEGFSQTLVDLAENDGFVVQMFAYEDGKDTKLLAVMRQKRDLFVTGCSVNKEFDSLTSANEKFHMFEREIAEQYGIRPLNHPWLKMVRYHANCTGAQDVFGNNYKEEIPGNYPYFQVEGEDIHEVAVGPVHAGIIEPGHFRFQCIGEVVLHLEIQLGYQHRGVEKMLPKVPKKRLPIICETIAGDTTIGHNLCCCQAIEGLAGLEVDEEARVVRTIALELERMANHVGDLGALSGDVAFNPPANYFGRLRGDVLNLSQVLCGSRMGRGLVRPGGVAYVLKDEQRQLLRDKIAEIKPEIEHVCDLLFTANTVLARFEDTGKVPLERAEKLGLVGYAGRASGVGYDARDSFPTECYATLPVNRNTMTNGDVCSRATVRREEIMHSFSLIETLLDRKGDTEAVFMKDYKLSPSSFVVTLNEGWRGEVSHCILTDATGGILRYKVKDPSFHNWTGLAMALRNEEISEFPLCNKSFNLSYCGFDL
ncbi:MAG: hydrogenase [Desulfatibacillum sp.]|nr:hydrogenase [Desulfatibacillum sp.]